MRLLLAAFLLLSFGRLSLGCGDDSSPDAGVDSSVIDGNLPDGQRDAPSDGSSDAPARDASVDAAARDGSTGPRPIGPRPVTPTPLANGTLFASPTGTGDTCSEAAPCDIWEATDQANAGDVVFMRGGVYAIDRNLWFRGRGATPPAVFESYPGETAILEGTRDADDEYYVRVVDDPVVLRLFEIRNMSRAGISVRSSDNVLEGLRVYDNLLSGIHVHESYDTPVSNRNLITDCVTYGNSGAGLTSPTYADGGNSDGISMSSGIENRIENCLVYDNSDDGIDTWRTTDSYVGYSIVYGNGIASGNGQGIKAGGQPPSARTWVEHCLSYDNRSAGFDFNSGVDVVFVNNTAWNNDGSGFYASDDTRVERNIAVDDGSPFGGSATPEDNSWQREGEPSFISTDPSSADFLVPVAGGGFDDIGAHADRM